MNQPTCLAEPKIASFSQQQCQELLNELNGADQLIDSIRKIIASAPGLTLRFNDVADQLAMAPRTLRRRLQEKGKTYQQILNEVREKMAKEYLMTTPLSVDQIAEIVGGEAEFERHRSASRCALDPSGPACAPELLRAGPQHRLQPALAGQRADHLAATAVG